MDRMNAQHTPGPWRYEAGTKTLRSVPANYWLATMDSWDGAINNAANAARIVACLNACEGMADPAVEISGLRSRSDGVPAMCAAVEELRAEVRALRSALRGVLQHCVTVNGMPDKGNGRTESQQSAYDAARKAIEASQ